MREADISSACSGNHFSNPPMSLMAEEGTVAHEMKVKLLRESHTSLTDAKFQHGFWI